MTGGRSIVFNLHLDHQSQPSREKSAALLRRAHRRPRVPAGPAIVTGDFNVGEKNSALASLLARPATVPAAFVDTFRVLHPGETTVGTFTGFKFGKTGGEKIDYVLAPAGTEVLSAAIVRTSRSQRYPSDHFPVTARLRLKFPS